MNVPIWRDKIVLTAFLALVGTIIALYTNVPDALWVSIDGFLLIVISKFALDDVAAKVVASLNEFTAELRMLRLGKKEK